MIAATANAKINLGLHVARLDRDGFHQVAGLFQSIGWSDRLEMADGADGITGWDGGEVPDGADNTAWRAVEAVRRRLESRRSVSLRLDKRIPVAAGLGGGSTDAAAALQLACRWLGAPSSLAAELAADIGSDVPFCLEGGTALVTGRGEQVAALPAVLGYALAVVVPPVELSTADVYRAWDDLGGPAATPLPAGNLPPGLRSHAPLGNDLYPAAVAVAPLVAEWRHELEARWGRPVAMTGSGPTLFGFFVDRDEAEAAVAGIPTGARAAKAVVPVTNGWSMLANGENDGLDSPT
ncbi:MAG: 4-(cytidine 5'-diphospho)-2-C-methyl-D-erythritol kinase [Acidimicrobiia bacterium]|nr:4-(cytidine 5'-diphospho)-2-C-methyl-D-erythritol kinase [Acidimicrobiia bacterium]